MGASESFQIKGPVRWLSPAEMLRGGVRAVLSETIGDYADQREIVGLVDAKHYCRPATAVCYYVADVGDGFNSTFAVASAIARQSAEDDVASKDKDDYVPSVLVMGGDEVYPIATPKEYSTRTAGPYAAASAELSRLDRQRLGDDDYCKTAPNSSENRSIFAIPGNHDWYDGLSAFRRRFCSEGASMGAWCLPQHRSYFAIKLKEPWWIWGIDTAFEGRIDRRQWQYLRDARAQLSADSRVIVCLAKPAWLDCPEGDDQENEAYEPVRNIVRLIEQEFEGKPAASAPLVISGDKHFYARHQERREIEEGDEAPCRRQKIVAGGGGAYLSLTHDVPGAITAKEIDDGPDIHFDAKVLWPRKGTSRWMSLFGVVTVPARNWSLGVTIGVVYSLMALVLLSSTSGSGRSSMQWYEEIESASLQQIRTRLVSSAAVYIVVGLLVVLMYLLAQKGLKHDRWKAILAGSLHAVLHLVGIAVTVYLGSLAWQSGWGLAILVLAAVLFLFFEVYNGWDAIWSESIVDWLRHRKVWGPFLAAIAVIAALGAGFIRFDDTSGALTTNYFVSTVVVGGLIGTLLFSLYLVVAALVLHRNVNELSAGIQHQGFKNYLRLEVLDGGDLEVKAFGIRHVHRHVVDRDHPLADDDQEKQTLEKSDSVEIDSVRICAGVCSPDAHAKQVSVSR